MRKSKEEKGITLVALIVTVVVLSILAAVAIQAITNTNIVGKAQEETTEYNESVKEENTALDNYEDFMTENIDGTMVVGDATVGVIATRKSTINGQDCGADNPIIPKGFKAINTATSNWEASNLAVEVKKGLVIEDENKNQFVWIPVENINEFATLQDGSTKNYEGVFNVGGYAEPHKLASDNATNFSSITWTDTLYQDSFNNMVKSVQKFKGFYIGRYEMSLSSNGVAQSKAGETSANSSNTNAWWGLYEKATTYSKSGVRSEMIWGCQYEAMLRWMKTNNIDIQSATPMDTARGVAASLNTTRTTGASNSNDIINNIYDILGNSHDWTQACGSSQGGRAVYGGYYGNYCSPSTNYPYLPGDLADKYGTRLSLYIEA